MGSFDRKYHFSHYPTQAFLVLRSLNASFNSAGSYKDYSLQPSTLAMFDLLGKKSIL